MANTTFKLRRSSVAGKQPNTSTLSIGELGINLTDRKLYSSDGTNIFETGSNLTSLSVFSDISVGNSSVNTVVNSSSITVKSIVANGGIGTANQVLSSNGSGIYWTSPPGGASRTYSITTVSNTTTNTFSTPGSFVSGSTDVYLNGVHLSNAEYTETSSNTIQLTENAPNGSIIEVSGWVTINTLVAGSNTTIQFNDSGYINSSANFTWNKDSNTLTVGNSSVNTQIVAGNVFLNGSTLVIGNTAANVTVNGTVISVGTTTINSTVFSGTSNNTSFVGSIAAANVVSNAQLSSNLSSYQTTAGLSANVATLTANNANFVKANNGITSNSSGVFVTQGTGAVVNATGVHVNAAYINTISSNAAAFLTGNVVTTNSTVLSVGSNVTVNTSSLLVGNSTVNTTISNGNISVNGNNISPVQSFRNKIINGNFDIWQRGTSTSTAGYLADRWQTFAIGSTFTTSRQSFTLGQTSVPYEPTYWHRTVVTSVAGAGNYCGVAQCIESVRTLAGQTVTLSFWAKADASKNIAIELYQNFGTGGSPSTAVSTASTVSLTSSWAKYTVTATLPSISGKTLGSDNNDNLTVLFWFDAGSTNNSRTNSLGQQSGTFDIAQVQLEPGSFATPFEQRLIGTELALCQRYYYKRACINPEWLHALTCVNIYRSTTISFPVQMRTSPTITWTYAEESAGGTISTISTQDAVQVRVDVTNSGYWAYLITLTASAEY